MKKNHTNTEGKQPSRRALLRALGVGGVVVGGSNLLPERWTRPVVKSVILPAHAQTSPPTRVRPVVSFDSCSLSNATYNGTSGAANEVSVDVAYTVSSNFGLDLTIIGTMDATFTFQPSGTTVDSSFEADTDSSGNGTVSIPGIVGQPLIAPPAQTTVSMTITDAENTDGARVRPCTTADETITL